MHGNFKNRKELLNVPKLGAKAYEQAAGFLRVAHGDNPLDNTRIHPETYSAIKRALKTGQTEGKGLTRDAFMVLQHEVGEHSAQWIDQELKKPTRDPRTPLEATRQNTVSSIEDLRVGMELHGVINNITHFGAFVNMGIKESGLVHVSQVSDHFVKDIQTVVKLNQRVKVRVLEVDLQRKRVQLTMKGMN